MHLHHATLRSWDGGSMQRDPPYLGFLTLEQLLQTQVFQRLGYNFGWQRDVAVFDYDLLTLLRQY